MGVATSCCSDEHPELNGGVRESLAVGLRTYGQKANLGICWVLRAGLRGMCVQDLVLGSFGLGSNLTSSISLSHKTLSSRTAPLSSTALSKIPVENSACCQILVKMYVCSKVSRLLTLRLHKSKPFLHKLGCC